MVSRNGARERETASSNESVRKKSSSELYFVTGALVLVLLSLVGLFAFYERPTTTGNVALDVSRVKMDGQIITGQANILLTPGECIPEDSYLSVTYAGRRQIVAVSNYLDAPLVECDYFAIGNDLSGKGYGFGAAGKRNPEVSYQLEVASQGGQSQIVSGVVKRGSPTTHSIPSGASVSLVPGSVSSRGVGLSDGNVVLKISGSELIVSTGVYETGFGPEYIDSGDGAEPYIISVPIDSMNFVARSGNTNFDAELVSRETRVASAGAVVNVVGGRPRVIEDISGRAFNRAVNIDVNVDRTHGEVVLNEDVLWTEKIQLSEAARIRLELPKTAEEIKITRAETFVESNSGTSTALEVPRDLRVEVRRGNSVEVVRPESSSRITRSPASRRVSGFVVIELDLDDEENMQGGFFERLREMFTISGNLALDVQSEEEVVEVRTDEPVREIELRYYLPGPTSVETETENGKIVEILSDEHYTNALLYTYLGPEAVSAKVYELDGDERKEVKIEGVKRERGQKRIEWRSDLSHKMFEVIVVTSAQHLDGNRQFIEDIYEGVRFYDGVWSKEIPAGDYVRVTFDKEVSSTNDITIYPRVVSGTPKIDIYTENGDKIVAQFNNVLNEQYNKVYLSSLEGTEDTFDLLIKDGSLQFDHIIDPNVTPISECGTLSIENGYYELQQDVITTGTCFNITANNITFDGGGFRVTYGNQNSPTAFYGIRSEASETHVMNVVVRRGISAQTTQPRYGISFFGTTNGRIENVDTNSNWRGIHIQNGGGNVVETAVSSSNSQLGFAILSSSDNIVTDLTTNSNGLNGIHIASGDGNIITDFVSNDNAERGIHVAGSSENIFTDGEIRSSGKDAIGILTSGSNNNRFENVIIVGTDGAFDDLAIINEGIDGTHLLNTPIKEYSIAGAGGTLTIENDYGKIEFLEAVSGNGTNLSEEVFISNNFAEVLSTIATGFNQSAEVTLKNMPGNFRAPEIKMNHASCPSEICHNLTSLNAGTVVFEVTGWSNYSIGGSRLRVVAADVPENQTYSVDGDYEFRIQWADEEGMGESILTLNGVEYPMEPTGNPDEFVVVVPNTVDGNGNPLMGVGTHTFSFSGTNGGGGTTSVGGFSFEIEKSPMELSTYISGSKKHFTGEDAIGVGSRVKVTVGLGAVEFGGGHGSLGLPVRLELRDIFDEVILSWNDTDPLVQLIDFNDTGAFKIVGVFEGTHEYNDSQEEWEIEVTEDGAVLNDEPPAEESSEDSGSSGSSGGGGGSSPSSSPVSVSAPEATSPACEPVWAVDVGECIDGQMEVVYNDECGEVIVQKLECGSDFTCNEEFDCGAWSECNGGLQTRECHFTDLCEYAEQRECGATLSPSANTKATELLDLLRSGQGVLAIAIFLALGAFVFLMHFVMEPVRRINSLIATGEKALKQGDSARAVRNYLAMEKVYKKLSDADRAKLHNQYSDYYSKVKGHLK